MADGRESAEACREWVRKRRRRSITLLCYLVLWWGVARGERVRIGGVEDEVSAHTRLFVKGQNLEYQGLVNRVGERVVEWSIEI